MYEIHRTREGVELLIGQMTDDHLKATINAHLRIISKSRLIIEGNADNNQDTLVTILQPQFSKKAIQEQAKATLLYHHEKVQPYLCEALLRGLEEITDNLQRTYGRSQAIEGNLPLTPEILKILSLESST